MIVLGCGAPAAALGVAPSKDTLGEQVFLLREEHLHAPSGTVSAGYGCERFRVKRIVAPPL